MVIVTKASDNHLKAAFEDIRFAIGQNSDFAQGMQYAVDIFKESLESELNDHDATEHVKCHNVENDIPDDFNDIRNPNTSECNSGVVENVDININYLAYTSTKPSSYDKAAGGCNNSSKSLAQPESISNTEGSNVSGFRELRKLG